MQLTNHQHKIVESPLKGTIFLEGAAGTGKSTAGTERLRYLLNQGVPADSILVMLPQRALSLPYRRILSESKRIPGGQVGLHTIGSLSQTMVDLFFPLVAEEAGFGQPLGRPQFLTLETAQYYMQRVVGAVIDEKDYFASVTIQRSRLYSQIIDNLNKAAVGGFPHYEIGERLKSAWNGEISQVYIYDEAQDCANIFRKFCLENNLLDFSLQVDVFLNHIWQMDQPRTRTYLQNQFKHLIFDNLEEDNPATHSLLREWLPQFESALMIFDRDAGFRRFLGSDAENGYSLKSLFDQQIQWDDSLVMPSALTTFAYGLARVLNRPEPAPPTERADPREVLHYTDHTYHPQMVDWVAEQIQELIEEKGVSPDEIVVLAPFLSDALRFALMTRLQERGVPARSHRPSRPLNAEPAARTLMTLAHLAHPQWKIIPTVYDVAYALTNALSDFDLVRAQLLANIVFRKNELTSFDDINVDMQERITFEFGSRYEALRTWLRQYQEGEPDELDVFLSRLFGEVLSQVGFGFHHDFDAARIAANLIDSARAFRWTISEQLEKSVGQEYAEMVAQGVIANQYLRDWDEPEEDSVLLAPAFTFLMGNQPVDYQFWLNVGSAGWWERLYQPLTHPYVLSLQWEQGHIWSDSDEYEARQDTLYRLVLGLLRRCREGVYLGFSQLGEQGYEQRGPLLDAVQRILRRLQMAD